jgi:hypothetical protein
MCTTYCQEAPKLQALESDFLATEQAITEALVAEWKYDPSNGCLGYVLHTPQAPNQPIAANACDIAPQAFAEHYAGLFKTQRQAAYA